MSFHRRHEDNYEIVLMKFERKVPYSRSGGASKHRKTRIKYRTEVYYKHVHLAIPDLPNWMEPAPMPSWLVHHEEDKKNELSRALRLQYAS